LMQSTHYALHPLLPGAAYGFTEMRRHAWRALQHDGIAGDFASRLVIVPEAKLAYFIVVDGTAGPQFWRALDNGLFDKLLPTPGRDVSATSASAPAPVQADADALAGQYEAIRNRATEAAPLKIADRIAVRAGQAGALILTSAESVTLLPRPGGYWESADGDVTAVSVMRKLVLDTGAYGRLALYKRPMLYLLLALFAFLAGAGIFVFDRRRTQKKHLPRAAAPVLAGVGVIFVLLSAAFWFLSTGA
jgi:hypothetical protein